MVYLLDTHNGVHFTQLIQCNVTVDMMIPVNFLPGRIGQTDVRIRQHIPSGAAGI
jgi:hypothetical protein